MNFLNIWKIQNNNLEGKLWQTQCIGKQRYHFADKGMCSQSYGFSSSHVWTIKKAEHWRTDPFELWCWRRLLRVPWTARRSNQSIWKEISSKYSLEDAETKALIFWPPGGKSQFIGRDPDAWNEDDWGQEEKGKTEDEIVGWHQWLNKHKFEQTPGVSEGQGSLMCCSSWDP